MVGYLFAGQGSQYIGMGKEFYDSFPESKAVFDKADQVLGFSLSQLCFRGPQEELTKTLNCQPAILTTSIAIWEAFRRVYKAQAAEGVYAAGLSLGEYSALIAAGAISFEDGVSLVRKRGQLMEENAGAAPGSMLSIIGLELETVKEICARTKTEIANINCPGQTVIAGAQAAVNQAEDFAKEKGAKLTLPLEVSAAFHSSFMKGASERFAGEVEKVKINTPLFKVVSNVDARPVNSPAEIKDRLVKQVASSVLWEPSMRYILSQGVTDFFEFGPGKVLKGLMRRIDANANVASIEKKEDLANSVKEE